MLEMTRPRRCCWWRRAHNETVLVHVWARCPQPHNAITTWLRMASAHSLMCPPEIARTTVDNRRLLRSCEGDRDSFPTGNQSQIIESDKARV